VEAFPGQKRLSVTDRQSDDAGDEWESFGGVGRICHPAMQVVDRGGRGGRCPVLSGDVLTVEARGKVDHLASQTSVSKSAHPQELHQANVNTIRGLADLRARRAHEI